jgi:hypothetical protein
VDASRTILHVVPRQFATNHDQNVVEPTFLLRSFLLPNTIVSHYKQDENSKLPSTTVIRTSLGVCDIWKHYSLPGLDCLPSLVACVQQSFLRVELGSTQENPATLYISLTRLALETCNIPISLNSPQSKQRQRANQVRVVLASFFPAISPQAPSSSSAPNVSAQQIYKLIDNVQLQNWMDKKNSSASNVETRQFPGLIPTLRPYQNAAVEWRMESLLSCRTTGTRI